MITINKPEIYIFVNGIIALSRFIFGVLCLLFSVALFLICINKITEFLAIVIYKLMNGGI
jgi:phage-related holin